MSADYVHKNLSREEYFAWLNSFLSIINDFANIGKNKNDARTIAFMRVAEHVFNYFIDQTHRYEDLMDEKGATFYKVDLSKITYMDLKFARDRAAGKLADCIINDPEIRQRHQLLCDRLKEPVILGCML